MRIQNKPALLKNWRTQRDTLRLKNVGGFSLVELLIAMLIVSFFAPMLLTSLYESGRFQTRVDDLIAIHTRLGVANNQLEKDLMGAFVPVQAEKKEKEEEQEISVAGKGDQKEPKTKKPDEKKPLEKIFLSVHKDGQLQSLSFISNDPMEVYVGKKVGMVKPDIVRVHYTIQPEEDRKDSYVLLRQESTELEIEHYKDTKQIRAYELLHGIKSISCTFTACIEKKKEEKPQAPEKPIVGKDGENAAEKDVEEVEPTYEYKTVSEWSSEMANPDASSTGGTKSTSSGSVTSSTIAGNAKSDDSNIWPRIPCIVECKLTLWDAHYKKDRSFVFIFIIPIDATIARPKKEKQQKPKAPVKKPSAPPQGGDQKKQAFNTKPHSNLRSASQQNSSFSMQGKRSAQAPTYAIMSGDRQIQQPIVVYNQPTKGQQRSVNTVPVGEKSAITSLDDLIKLFAPNT